MFRPSIDLETCRFDAVEHRYHLRACESQHHPCSGQGGCKCLGHDVQVDGGEEQNFDGFLFVGTAAGLAELHEELGMEENPCH